MSERILYVHSCYLSVPDIFIAIVTDSRSSHVYVCQPFFPLSESTSTSTLSDYIFHHSFAKSNGKKVLTDVRSKYLSHVVDCFSSNPLAYIDPSTNEHHLAWAVSHRYALLRGMTIFLVFKLIS